MADTYSLEVSAQLLLGVLGSVNVTPPKLTGTANYAVLSLVLQNGDNTISYVAGCNFALVLFDPTSLTTKKLKGAGGDTGVSIDGDTLAVIPLVAAGGSFIINSSALDGVLVTRVVFF